MKKARSAPSFVRRLGGGLLRRLPRRLRPEANILRAARHKQIRLFSRKCRRVPDHTFVINLADDLDTMHTCCNYHGLGLEREQAPAVTLFGDEYFATLGVLPDGMREPASYVIKFRGQTLEHSPGSGAWPPSLSSYILALALINTWSASESRLWDVGAGSGIVGLHVLALTSCEEVLLTDMVPSAVERAQANATGFHGGRAMARVESFPPEIPPDPIYDVLVCNPPFLPRGFMGAQDGFERQPFETSLTKALLESGTKYAKRVVVGFSSVQLAEVTTVLSQLRSRGTESRILATTRLPLPIPVYQAPRELPEGVFREGPNPRFSPWHDYYVCELIGAGPPVIARPDTRGASAADGRSGKQPQGD